MCQLIRIPVHTEISFGEMAIDESISYFAENNISVRISWTVTRETNNPPTVAPVASGKGDDIELVPGDENREYLMNMINGTKTKPVKILSIFPKFLKIKNSGKAEVANDLNQGIKITYAEIFVILI